MDVPCLKYVIHFLDGEAQASLVAEIDRQPWSNELKRRVQHYGYKYDYKARSIDHSMFLGNLPPFLERLAVSLKARGHFKEAPNQVIVNEYLPGQGIGAHVDCVPCFGDTVATISLLWAYPMHFKRIGTGFVVTHVLAPGSLLVLKEDARYRWTHGIGACLADDGIPRQRRLSVTFRSVNLL